MELTTLCYIEKDNCYLMLHRIKKNQDINKGKWIGVGGHFEAGESPDDCLLREVKEETGMELTRYQFRGVVTFCYQPGNICEYMCLYTADGFIGEPGDCSEGELKWVPKKEIGSLSLWEGDRIFLRLLETEASFFSLKLCYEKDRMTAAVLNGSPLELFDIRNENGQCTGEVRERTVAHEDGSLHGTAHIWAVRYNSDNEPELLLQKRSYAKDSFAGCYDISSAGHLACGDDFLTGAVRELSEELGIACQKDDLSFIGFYRGFYEGQFHGRPFINNEISAVYLYKEEIDINTLTLQPEEVDSVCWMKLSEVISRVEANDPGFCIWKDELDMVSSSLLPKP